MTNREIDALVAEKVMGYEVPYHPHYPKDSPRYADENGDCHVIPMYSTDIAAAWQVVEKMTNDGYTIGVSIDLDAPENCRWDCHIRKDLTKRSPVECAPTAELAICLAALKAVGVEVL